MHPYYPRRSVEIFFESKFGYYPLVCMIHSRTLNNRIYKLHQKAFQELLDKENSVSIHDRILQKLAIEMYRDQRD